MRTSELSVGDIIYLRVFDMDVVVLNTLPVTLELLDKRSEVYSDRPSTTSLVAP